MAGVAALFASPAIPFPSTSSSPCSCRFSPAVACAPRHPPERRVLQCFDEVEGVSKKRWGIDGHLSSSPTTPSLHTLFLLRWAQGGLEGALGRRGDGRRRRVMRPNLVVLELGEHSSVVKQSPDPATCPPRPPLPLRPDLAMAAVVRAVVASRCGDAALPAFTDWLLGHHRDCRLPTRGHHPSQPASNSGQRTLSSPVTDSSKLPKWNYDGSSTGQAPSEDSEVILYPQAIFKDPIRRGNNILVRY